MAQAGDPPPIAVDAPSRLVNGADDIECRQRQTGGAHRRALSSARSAVGPTTLLLPVVVLFSIFFVWPLVDIFVRSINQEGLAALASRQLTAGNYTALVHDPVLRHIAIHTFIVALITTAVTALLAFPCSYLLSRSSSRTTTVVLAVIMIPFWVSIVVRLFAFTEILGRYGVVNNLVGHVGLGPYQLLFNTTATVIGMVAYLLPYMILVLYSGMNGIDHSLVTAAKTLGANGLQAFSRVYFPLVRTSLVAGMLLVFVLSLGFFLTPAILGSPTDATIATYIQTQINIYQWGTASAGGIMLLVVTLVGYSFAVRGGGLTLGAGSPALGKGTVHDERLTLSPTSVLLWIFTVIVLAFLLLPLIIIIPTSVETSQLLAWPPTGFTTTWYSQVIHDPTWTGAIRKSAVVGGITAALATSVALVVARITSRFIRPSVRTLVQLLVYAPLVVPVILFAIGLYDIEARLGMLQTTYGLVFAHTVLAFPLAFAVLSAALANLDPALEHAAWTMGASKTATFWRVVVPNLIPGILGALVISFATSWDEAVVALFQTGLSKTLPVTIFSFLNSGAQPTVAAIATILVAFVVVLMALVFGVNRQWARRRTGRRASYLLNTNNSAQRGAAIQMNLGRRGG